MISARALGQTEAERQVMYQFAVVSIPAWGRVVDTAIGKVLLYDPPNAAGVSERRYSLLSGPAPEVAALERRVNQEAYVSPDAGLQAFVEDLSRRAASMFQSLVGLALVVAAVMVLKELKTA